jgi:hypothetical protein
MLLSYPLSNKNSPIAGGVVILVKWIGWKSYFRRFLQIITLTAAKPVEYSSSHLQPFFAGPAHPMFEAIFLMLHL